MMENALGILFYEPPSCATAAQKFLISGLGVAGPDHAATTKKLFLEALPRAPA
jgi:hypothetical protein